MAFAAFLKRKRYSTSKPQSYIKVSQKQSATIMAKQDEDKQERPSIVFTGKDIVQWFKFDRQVTRYAKKKYGQMGSDIWKNTAVPITAETRRKSGH